MTEVSPTAPGTSEAYNLTIAFPRATLTAGTVYGAMRGIETFSQLVGAGHTPIQTALITSGLCGTARALTIKRP